MFNNSFFKGVAQGCGIVFGLMLMIMLMQLSAFILKYFGVFN